MNGFYAYANGARLSDSGEIGANCPSLDKIEFRGYSGSNVAYDVGRGV